jgi:copper chaperone CopZ
MRSLFHIVALVVVGSTATGYAQESKTPPAKRDVTKAMFMVTGLHCAPCTTTVERSLQKVKGVDGIKVDFAGQYATIEFQENIISAQEVARAISGTPHMMGRGMQYGGAHVLYVAGVNDEATGKKAAAALRAVDGVGKVTLYPKQQAVGIDFTPNGKVTSKQLTDALKGVGLTGEQNISTGESAAQAKNGSSDSMPDHAGMNMGNGAMTGHAMMGQGMGCMCGSSMQMTGTGSSGRSAGSVRGGCCR